MFFCQSPGLLIKFVYRAAEGLAYLGGLLLCLLALMIVISVGGRALIWLGLGPIPGDFELVEMGTAIVVFCFLPWCYLKDGHATVDMIYMHLPRWSQRAVMVGSDLLMLLVWLVLTWRLAIAVGDKFREQETSFILALPLWWAYAVSLFGAALGCVVYLTKTLVELGWARPPAGSVRDATGSHF